MNQQELKGHLLNRRKNLLNVDNLDLGYHRIPVPLNSLIGNTRTTILKGSNMIDEMTVDRQALNEVLEAHQRYDSPDQPLVLSEYAEMALFEGN